MVYNKVWWRNLDVRIYSSFIIMLRMIRYSLWKSFICCYGCRILIIDFEEWVDDYIIIIFCKIFIFFDGKLNVKYIYKEDKFFIFVN